MYTMDMVRLPDGRYVNQQQLANMGLQASTGGQVSPTGQLPVQPQMPMGGGQMGGQQGLMSLLQMLGPFLMPLLRSYMQQQQGMGGQPGMGQQPLSGLGGQPQGPMPPPPYQGPPGVQTMTPGGSRFQPMPMQGQPLGPARSAPENPLMFSTVRAPDPVGPPAPFPMPTQTLRPGPAPGEVIGQGFDGAAGTPGQSY